MTKCSSPISITPIERAPFRPAGASQFDIASKRGDSYRIFLYEPPIAAPPEGFPVFYLLDGNATFMTAVETVAMQMRRPEATGVPPSVIIGIGYPTDAPLDIERRRFDYTPKGAKEGTQAGVGGAVYFSDFIETDLKPIVEAMVPIDRRRQALFGHSFGGLFTLWSLFTHLELFQSYIAASPSIWWGGRCILTHEAAFIKKMREASTEARLLLTVGSLEQFPHPDHTESKSSMVEDAAALGSRLAFQAGDRFKVSFVELTEETHVSVVPAAISRSVRFAWPNP